MRIDVLASGSAGNATVVAHEGESILIDAGLSASALLQRMRRQCGPDSPSKIKAILLTHEHGDHSAAAADLSKKLRIPVICTQGTAEAMPWGDLADVLVIPGDCVFNAGLFSATAIAVPHDAAEPCGFTISAKNCEQLAYFMDMGTITEQAAEAMRCSAAIFLESNHDTELIRTSAMDESVKRRVTGAYGHLSNQLVAQFAAEYLPGWSGRLVLGHLSSGNNSVERVRASVAGSLPFATVNVIEPTGSFAFEV